MPRSAEPIDELARTHDIERDLLGADREQVEIARDDRLGAAGCRERREIVVVEIATDRRVGAGLLAAPTQSLGRRSFRRALAQTPIAALRTVPKRSGEWRSVSSSLALRARLVDGWRVDVGDVLVDVRLGEPAGDGELVDDQAPGG